MNLKDKIDIWIKLFTLIGSISAFLFTIVTWREQIRITRADFLEAKIIEFEDSSTLIARSILDGFAVCNPCNSKELSISDKDMIFIGSTRLNVETDIKLENLDDALYESFPSTNISKHRIRLSFDKLLDFFGKLDYYLDLGLMTKDEVIYFRYFIEKCAKNEIIMEYACQYSFKSFLSLVRTLNLSNSECRNLNLEE